MQDFIQHYLASTASTSIRYRFCENNQVEYFFYTVQNNLQYWPQLSLTVTYITWPANNIFSSELCESVKDNMHEIILLYSVNIHT